MAEATKHTPGKWHIDTADSTLICGADGYQTCSTGYSHRPDDEAEANARLIAAAPELLECLQETLSLVERLAPYVTDTIKNSRAAIAKATGV